MYEPNSEQLQAVILSQDLIEQVAQLSDLVNDETLGVKIEPLKLYCQKTGHIIGERDQNSLFSLTKIHGKNAIIKSLYNAVSLSVHPAWIETNGEKLDFLMDQDPIGYACYCFGLITADFYQNHKNTDKKRQPWVERYWALARANSLLQTRGISDLTALNIELCKLLTYAPDTKSYLFKRARKMAQTPDMLAMLHCSGELTQLLRDCTNRAIAAIGYVDKYIQKTRFVDYAATPADAARGPSNIRQQKASKRDVKEAGMFAELRKLFDDSGLEGMGIFQNKSFTQNGNVGVLQARIAETNTAAKEEAMLQDLYDIGGTNLDDMFNPETDEDNNEVEVSFLARSQEPKLKTIDHDDQNQDIAEDIIKTIHEAPINSVMVEIAKQVLENVVENPEIIPHDPEVFEAVLKELEKPMTALERIRARKGAK